jgi:hypothetical protein
MREKNLVKYAVTLLVVAIICIAIGGISMSRSIVRTDRENKGTLNAVNKVAEISEANMILTGENKALKEEASKYASRAAVLEKENRAYSLYYEMQNTLEGPVKESIREEILKLDIDQELKTKLTK